jgi:hypothetical protein
MQENVSLLDENGTYVLSVVFLKLEENVIGTLPPLPDKVAV